MHMKLKFAHEAQVITFATIKGGTGKTTAVAAVADVLGHEGNRMLVIDADPRANLSKRFDTSSVLCRDVGPVLFATDFVNTRSSSQKSPTASSAQPKTRSWPGDVRVPHR